jgi:hypothetical protein
MNPVTIWDDRTAEERTVMTTATEEGYLNGVIGDFLGHPEHGGAIWIFSNDTDAIRALIPRFTAVVLDMIERGLIDDHDYRRRRSAARTLSRSTDQLSSLA